MSKFLDGALAHVPPGPGPSGSAWPRGDLPPPRAEMTEAGGRRIDRSTESLFSAGPILLPSQVQYHSDLSLGHWAEADRTQVAGTARRKRLPSDRSLFM
jgi:hypothetical protein